MDTTKYVGYNCFHSMMEAREIMTKERIILSPKTLKSLIKTYKIKRVALFGSYARGKPTKKSDVDFLVEFKREADLLDQVALKIALEHILHKKVDVVTPASLSKYFRAQVLKEAVPL